MAQIEFHFDFGSPNAYLAHLVIPQIEQRTGSKFAYVPVLLGGVFKLTGNRSPAEAFAGMDSDVEVLSLHVLKGVQVTARPVPGFSAGDVKSDHAGVPVPDGKLGERILGTTKAVKDQCKALAIGPCAPPSGISIGTTLQPLEEITSAWVHWYNTARLMHRLGRRPPAEAEAQYYQQARDAA